VRLLQGPDDAIDQGIVADQFDPIFRHLLNLTTRSHERLAAIQRTELALSLRLPGAAVVIANASAAGTKIADFVFSR